MSISLSPALENISIETASYSITMRISVLGFLLTVLSEVSSVLVTRVATRVSTTSGLIVGHGSPNKTRVTEYLGVPYAAYSGEFYLIPH